MPGLVISMAYRKYGAVALLGGNEAGDSEAAWSPWQQWQTSGKKGWSMRKGILRNVADADDKKGKRTMTEKDKFFKTEVIPASRWHIPAPSS